ncbi:MAG TPA: SIMPL domain-containing protein [Allosphingosinicella sp.]|nr:SIMPL domain-containing protein [Allosphingosinicella sp.]
MKRLFPLFILVAALPAAARAQPAPAMTGTRLDIVATGEVSRVPDLARITAGVVAVAPTATAALADNARRMAAVRAALGRAGIADRDVRTSNVSLFPQYRQDQDRAPQINGYQATNEVSVRFRDIAASGAILDALVAQGANQISGPTLEVSKPDEALDEARVKALAAARARADLYARAAGKHVVRMVSISEAGAAIPVEPRPMAFARAATTGIDPGEQSLSVTLSVSFELE